MKEIEFYQLLEEFEEEVHERIRGLVERGATHFVVFQNQMFDSSHLGEKTALAIGPGFTYKTLAEVEGKWLYDLPSQRQYPVRYAEVKHD